jgi:hypothetical protein
MAVPPVPVLGSHLRTRARARACIYPEQAEQVEQLRIGVRDQCVSCSGWVASLFRRRNSI